jgi:hypothetical protein
MVLAAGAASAQDPLTTAKNSANKAVAATNARTEAMQKTDAQQSKAQPKNTPAPQAKGAAPKTPQGASKGAAKGTQRPGSQLSVAATDTAGPPPSILREVYDYARDGRRDPFVSLLTTTDLRPTMSDLRLTSILVAGGGTSIAVLRDVGTNAQYRVRVGSTLGRMRVTAIRPRTVLLTIDEFGTSRQDSLVLGDSSKVRRP